MPHLPTHRAGCETTLQPRSELFVQFVVRSVVRSDWVRVAVRPVVRLAPSLLLAVLIAPLSGCDDGDASAKSEGAWKSKRATVEVTTVQPQLLRDTVTLSGSLTAESQVLIRPEIDGVVASIDFREGRPVVKGQVLFQLHNEEQSARLQEALAEERLAQDVYDRTQRLRRQDVSSMARHEEASAKLDQAKARVSLAELEVRRTRLRAPFDGVAGQRLVSIGDRVDEKVGMVTVSAIDRLQLLFTVTEQGIALARTGVPIDVRVAAWPGDTFAGEVFFVSPSVDPVSRRLLLKAWVPNLDGKLKPGMFANIDVLISLREDALLLPESALVYDRNGTYLWRVDDENRAEKIPIEIGLRQAGRVEILKGVVSGDRIVSAGTNKVKAGSEIDAVEPQTAVTRERPSPSSSELLEGET